MNPEALKQPEIFTMSDAELAAKVDGDFRGEISRYGMNHVQKTALYVDLRFALEKDGGQAVYQWRKHHYGEIHANNKLTPEQEAAVIRYYGARLAWIEANRTDDITPEQIASAVRYLGTELERAGRLNRTLGDVIDVDEWSPHHATGESPMPKSPTHEKIAGRFASVVREIQDRTAELITIPQALLLREINGRTWRNTQRFFTQRVTGDVEKFRFVDVAILSHYGASPENVYARFLSADFERTIKECRTIKEVRAVCEIWHTPTIVATLAGHRIVLSQEKTPDGAHWLMIAPIELREVATYDEISAVQWGKK